jgi:hypothetical protein
VGEIGDKMLMVCIEEKENSSVVVGEEAQEALTTGS